jgi:hypothetical protein
MTHAIATRPMGGTVILAAEAGWHGRTETVLQSWPEWSSEQAGNLSLSLSPGQGAVLRGLGRRAQLRLQLGNQAISSQVRLMAAVDAPVSLRIAGCAIVGGSCAALQSNGELPATISLPAGATGQIEIELMMRTAEQPTTGTLRFLLAARTEQLETTLDDNQLEVDFVLGPFRDGFE